MSQTARVIDKIVWFPALRAEEGESETGDRRRVPFPAVAMSGSEGCETAGARGKGGGVGKSDHQRTCAAAGEGR